MRAYIDRLAVIVEVLLQDMLAVCQPEAEPDIAWRADDVLPDAMHRRIRGAGGAFDQHIAQPLDAIVGHLGVTAPLAAGNRRQWFVHRIGWFLVVTRQTSLVTRHSSPVMFALDE
jgi:hypothetical protein